MNLSCSVLCIFWPLVRRGKCFFFNARNIHRKSKQSIGYWMFVKFSIKFRSAHMHMHWEKSNDDDDGYNGDSEDETTTESMCITNLKETKSYSRIPGKRCIEVKKQYSLDVRSILCKHTRIQTRTPALMSLMQQLLSNYFIYIKFFHKCSKL